ncbi:MAG: hypothetical protein M0Q41_01190 [Bacteroidales bacterium]|nr:hypothetical protein [Bacteroidales bacterium]
MITKTIEIEDLVRDYPFSVRYLMEKGIKCIACGEPIWGTLEEAALEKGFDGTAIQSFVDEMNHIAQSGDSANNQTKAKISPTRLDL